jgi:Heparinase II/III-like protein/Heparinase II/III N-terminus
MGTGEIDLTTAGTGLANTPGRLVDLLEAVSRDWSDLPFLGIHSVTARPRDVDAALGGTFRHHDEDFALSPPVDWWDEPYKGANERGFFQNSFVFADPLLADPRFAETLTSLAAIFVDWLKANPRSEPTHPHRYAWHDHAAAGRIVSMAHVLREGIRRESFDRVTAEALASGVQEHAAYLLAEENYAAHNNHGFASDAALTLAARSLAPAPEAKAWAEIAERRFAAVLDYTIDNREALHLEHSPSYHWIIRGALGRFADGGLFGELGLKELTNRMAESGAWIVAPDGSLPPFGDTSIGQRPPRVASTIGEDFSGMKVFPRTGFAAVRVNGSALFVTAAHHRTAHKHADDGSFCLYEGGRAIVLDSGNPGYEYDSPEFRYGTSPAAHATICIDGFDWAKNSPAYGSGIVASAERAGLFALLTRNPNAVPGGGAARRVLVYAPGKLLLVIDDVEATGDHRLSRHLPLAPGLEAKPTKRGEVEILDGDSRIARLAQAPSPEAPAEDVEVAFGRRVPQLGGFRFLTPEEPCASFDVTLAGPAEGPRAYALLIGSTTAAQPAMTWTEADGGLDVVVTGLTVSPLEIRIREGALGLGYVD